MFRFEEGGAVLCQECYYIRTNREYCPICYHNWLKLNGPDDGDMIECTCKMWIHKKCDPLLTQETFTEFCSEKTTKGYYCPLCRRNQKFK